MQWKKLGKFLLTCFVVSFLILIGYKINESRANKLDPNRALKYFPKNQTVEATFTIDLKVIGSGSYGSPSISATFISKNETNSMRCSTTQGRKTETPCKMTMQLIHDRHDGDEVIVEINRMFALAKPNERQMLYRKYKLANNTVVENDSWTDPNGYGNGTVSLRVGPKTSP